MSDVSDRQAAKSNDPILDVVILPWTPEVKALTQASDVPQKDRMMRQPFWSKEYAGSDDLIRILDDAGLTGGLLSAAVFGPWRMPYDVVEQMVKAQPRRLFGVAGIDPTRIREGVVQVEDAIRNRGFVGASSYPHWYGVSPADRVFYPFYWKCAELDVPVQIQAGLANQPHLPNTGHPSSFDRIASDFPELKLVAIHTGYPWERELVSVAWKHPNVYIGADSYDPREWGSDLVDYIKGAGREKVMFGTNYPVVEFGEALAGLEELGLDPDIRRLLVGGNLARVYGIEEHVSAPA